MSLVVRAVDVGYGHVKFTDGFDGESILAESFPSQSVVSSASQHQSKVWQQRDTFQIPIGDRLYEVGRDIRFAMTGTQETEVLDQDFALSDAYRARLYGALNYMRPRLPRQHIDFLVLGLPLTTYNKHSKALADLYTGPQTIGPNQVITIGECVVIEQPVGSYLTYLTDMRTKPRAPWLCGRGFSPSPFFSQILHWLQSSVISGRQKRSSQAAKRPSQAQPARK